MKIGIFDSGLGGLVIAKSLLHLLPKYDYIYLGDTKNLPYGQKSPVQIYRHSQKAVDFLFKAGCGLVIIACNSASAVALRKLQQKYLVKNYLDRKILGVIIPTLEVADQSHKRKKIGVIGTKATIKSHIYKKELTKIDAKAQIFELATPKLVPLIETNSLQKAVKSLELYLFPLKKKGIEALVLGCTHYPLLKIECKKILGPKVAVISQDEIIPFKLKTYLKKHSEIARRLSKKGTRKFLVTAGNKNFNTVAKRLFGKNLNLVKTKI